ncbi:MAG: hypothetical protein P4L40_09990 [Terracidiphilus sp.]|nr:hypothetical protein [Terracidiphilus sp.]
MKRTLMLGMAVLAGALGMGAAKANAAQFGVYVGVQPAYVQPPCPGPGYQWAAGYWNAGYWIPGRWNYVGIRGGYDRYYAVDRDRRWDRDDFRSRDWDHDRGRHNGWGHDDHRDRDRGWDRDRH